MKRIIIPVAIALLTAFNFNTAYGQDMFDILSEYLNEEQSDALTRLQEDIAKGEKLVSQAETQDKANAKFLGSDKKGKQKKGEKKSVEAKSNRIKATKYYEKSYTALHGLYQSVLENVTFTYPNDKTEADQLLADAENLLKEGSAKVKPYGSLGSKQLETKAYATIKTDLAAAKGKFENAGETCYQALSLYVRQAEKKNKEEQEEQKYWNSSVSTNTIQAYKNYLAKYPSGKYVSEANRRIAALQAAAAPHRVTSDNPDEGLAYRIQICADKKPWSANKLRRLYKGNLTIDERESDGYYKYWIGCYRSYDDAHEAEQKLKLRQSFIVCFNNGQQIHVTEAQQIESTFVD